MNVFQHRKKNDLYGNFLCKKCNSTFYISASILKKMSRCVCNKCIQKQQKIRLDRKRTNTYGIQKTRQILLELRGSRCEKCLKYIYDTSKLHMHHKDRNRANNQLHNLILLCVPCHKQEHPDSPFLK